MLAYGFKLLCVLRRLFAHTFFLVLWPHSLARLMHRAHVSQNTFPGSCYESWLMRGAPCAVMTPGTLGQRRTFLLGKWNSRRLARAAFGLFLGEHPVDARAKYMSGQCVLYVTNGFTCAPGLPARPPYLAGACARAALRQAA